MWALKKSGMAIVFVLGVMWGGFLGWYILCPNEAFPMPYPIEHGDGRWQKILGIDWKVPYSGDPWGQEMVNAGDEIKIRLRVKISKTDVPNHPYDSVFLWGDLNHDLTFDPSEFLVRKKILRLPFTPAKVFTFKSKVLINEDTWFLSRVGCNIPNYNKADAYIPFTQGGAKFAQIQTHAIPEPPAWALMLTGIIFLFFSQKRIIKTRKNKCES